MKVKDILKITARVLQNDELSSYLGGESNSEETAKEVDKLFACFKLVISELCEEFLPVTKVENFSSTDGVIPFSSFSLVPLEIKSVYQRDNEVDFSVNPLQLKTVSGEVTVVYEYYPDILTLEDECPYAKTRISDRIIALGVAREYALLCGLYDEAVSLDKRFSQSLSAVMFPKKLKRVKARGWF